MYDPRLYASLSRIESTTVDQRLLEEGHREEKDENGLTIFIPNWNHRPFLPRSLRSALDALGHLEREGFSAEILVVDDASRDGSQKFLRTVQALYGEPRLNTLCLQRNYGQARLWNLALRVSKFRYVCRVDSDNELVPENLPLFLRSLLDTRATLVYGNLIGKQGDDVVGTRSNMAPTLRLTKFNYIDAFSVVDGKRILELGGYARLNPYSPEDWEMPLHLIAEEERIVFVPVVLGYYHEHSLADESELPLANAGVSALHSVYSQTGTREWDDVQVGRIYHPDVGFVDEW